jgi:hypothetical protein
MYLVHSSHTQFGVIYYVPFRPVRSISITVLILVPFVELLNFRFSDISIRLIIFVIYFFQLDLI